MKPPSYHDLNHAQCCGKCRFAGRQPNAYNLMCFFDDSPESVNESVVLAGAELEQWWLHRSVECDGICDEFRPGQPQNLAFGNEYQEVKP